jgi:hypothetical protein
MGPPPIPRELPLYGPETSVAEWHTPPPPDPLLARRVKNLRWEKAALVAGTILAIPLLLAGFRFLLSAWWVIGNLYAVLAAWVWTRRSPPLVSHLMDLPPTPGQFPVHIQYIVDGIVYGRDAGVATLMGSWVTFQGLESEFAFQRNQATVSPATVRSFLAKSKKPEVGLRLEFRESGHRYQIGVRAYDRLDGVKVGYKNLFHSASAEWMNLREWTTGEPTLPPLTPHPTTLRRTRLNLLLTITLAATPIVGLLAWLATHRLGDYWASSLLICAYLSATIGYFARRDWKREVALRSLLPYKSNQTSTRETLPNPANPTQEVDQPQIQNQVRHIGGGTG